MYRPLTASWPRDGLMSMWLSVNLNVVFPAMEDNPEYKTHHLCLGKDHLIKISKSQSFRKNIKISNFPWTPYMCSITFVHLTLIRMIWCVPWGYTACALSRCDSEVVKQSVGGEGVSAATVPELPRPRENWPHGGAVDVRWATLLLTLTSGTVYYFQVEIDVD